MSYPKNMWEALGLDKTEPKTKPSKRTERKVRTNQKILNEINSKFIDLRCKLFFGRGFVTRKVLSKRRQKVEKFTHRNMEKIDRLQFFDTIYNNPLALKYKIRFDLMKFKYDALLKLHEWPSSRL